MGLGLFLVMGIEGETEGTLQKCDAENIAENHDILNKQIKSF